MKDKFYKSMQGLITDSIKLGERGRRARVQGANLAAWEYFVMADATWKAYEEMLSAYNRLQGPNEFTKKEKVA